MTSVFSSPYLNKKRKTADDIIEIRLQGIKSITNLDEMFHDCSQLIELKGFSKWNIKNVNSMRQMFCNCTSLKKIKGIQIGIQVM